MSPSTLRQPIPLIVLSSVFIAVWLFIAAFPFLWTVWGSFKVEARFLLAAELAQRHHRAGDPAPDGRQLYRGWLLRRLRYQQFLAFGAQHRRRLDLCGDHLAHLRHVRGLRARALGPALLRPGS